MRADRRENAERGTAVTGERQGPVELDPGSTRGRRPSVPGTLPFRKGD